MKGSMFKISFYNQSTSRRTYAIHTYIHTLLVITTQSGLQSVRIMYLVSHTSYVVCVTFIHKWYRPSLKSTPNDRFFEKLFMAVFFNLLSEFFLPEICWEEIAEEIFFVFCFDVWPGERTLTLRLISQHTTY